MSFESVCEQMRKDEIWIRDWNRRQFVKACKAQDVGMIVVISDHMAIQTRRREDLLSKIQRVLKAPIV
jgi:hypothetical protein